MFLRNNAATMQFDTATCVNLLEILIEDLIDYANKFSLANRQAVQRRITNEFNEFTSYLNDAETKKELIERLVERGYPLVKDSDLNKEDLLKIPKTEYREKYAAHSEATLFSAQRRAFTKIISDHTAIINWIAVNQGIDLSKKSWLSGEYVQVVVEMLKDILSNLDQHKMKL